MKYLLLFKQRGHGCDYSIGCGTATRLVQANDIDGARSEVLKWLAYRGDEPGRSDIHCRGDKPMVYDLLSVYIVPFDDAVAFDLAALQQQRRDEAIALAKAAKTEWDRAEYERLKQKFKGNQ